LSTAWNFLASRMASHSVSVLVLWKREILNYSVDVHGESEVSWWLKNVPWHLNITVERAVKSVLLKYLLSEFLFIKTYSDQFCLALWSYWWFQNKNNFLNITQILEIHRNPSFFFIENWFYFMATVFVVRKGFKTEPVKTSVHRKLTVRLWILKETENSFTIAGLYLT